MEIYGEASKKLVFDCHGAKCQNSIVYCPGMNSSSNWNPLTTSCIVNCSYSGGEGNQCNGMSVFTPYGLNVNNNGHGSNSEKLVWLCDDSEEQSCEDSIVHCSNPFANTNTNKNTNTDKLDNNCTWSYSTSDEWECIGNCAIYTTTTTTIATTTATTTTTTTTTTTSLMGRNTTNQTLTMGTLQLTTLATAMNDNNNNSNNNNNNNDNNGNDGKNTSDDVSTLYLVIIVLISSLCIMVTLMSLVVFYRLTRSHGSQIERLEKKIDRLSRISLNSKPGSVNSVNNSSISRSRSRQSGLAMDVGKKSENSFSRSGNNNNLDVPGIHTHVNKDNSNYINNINKARNIVIHHSPESKSVPSSYINVKYNVNNNSNVDTDDQLRQRSHSIEGSEVCGIYVECWYMHMFMFVFVQTKIPINKM